MKDALDSYIDSIEHLPAAPVVMVKLIGLFRQEDRDVDEVVNLLSHDPSLTAEILRRCNSAHFSGEESVVDIFDAIMRVGFYEVYQTAMAMFGVKTMSLEKAKACIQVEDLWKHSAAVAVLAGALAKSIGESEGIAYTAGLLHDIGKIALASAEGKKYAELLKQPAPATRHQLEEAERSAFGFGHGAVGARLLDRWGVPLDISTPVFCHHHATFSDPFTKLSAVVSLANIMAHTMAQSDDAKTWEFPEANAAMTMLNISNEQLKEMAEASKEEIEGLGSLFASVPSR